MPSWSQNGVKVNISFDHSGWPRRLLRFAGTIGFLVLILCASLIGLPSPALTSAVLRPGKPESVGISPSALVEIDGVAEKAIAQGKIPGCVVLVARKGTIVWEKAYGYRSLRPEKVENSPDAIYDLASVTKPVATATAIALLLEDGKLSLDDKVVKYLPAFAQNGKGDITIAHLLTHVSGLKPYLDMDAVRKEGGLGPNPDFIIEHISALPKSYETGKSCVYSCLNFVVLARIVENVAREPMGNFLKRRVWQPLGMSDTGFFLTEEQRKRAAPTELDGPPESCGKVHDPIARYYITPDHVCGNAGLFSTAGDLAIFAQMLLNGGSYGEARILKPETVDLLTGVRTPDGLPKRGLGWDIDSPLAAQARGDVIPAADSFGHIGFTGCSLWIDKKSGAFVVILSNRTHVEKGDVVGLRSDIANIVGRSMDVYGDQVLPKAP